VDRFASHPLCFARDGQRLSFADTASDVPRDNAPRISAQALYSYLYFHCIPAPSTIFEGTERLRIAEQLMIADGQAQRNFHWSPAFDEAGRRDPATAAEEFRALLEAAVRRELAVEGPTGTYLSGGTDSSTVTGLVARLTGRPPDAFSIGFEAEGYDEMAYAQIAARQFGARHHEYYLTPGDLVRSIPAVAAFYDQPFGNSSALPAFYCAKTARERGVRRLLAGDGGDELFGGNARYARQKIFDIYNLVPSALRAALVEPALLGADWTTRVPLLKKVRSYVAQARVPMPARMQTYNLLQRVLPDGLLTADFLAAVDQGEPLRAQLDTWQRVADGSLVNRMLVYDWQYTLADSDLPKVCGTASMAGIDVGFPMLDDDLLDFSLLLPSDWKVKGLTLRHFFKQALRDFLPTEILRKSKHGFGLPFGVWLAHHEPLKEIVRESLGGLGERGVIERDYLARLERNIDVHAGYFGELAWILMFLEQWFRHRAPSFRIA
jgi:asparagine synthase (glutamine-hydrolysing)